MRHPSPKNHVEFNQRTTSNGKVLKTSKNIHWSFPSFQFQTCKTWLLNKLNISKATINIRIPFKMCFTSRSVQYITSAFRVCFHNIKLHLTKSYLCDEFQNVQELLSVKHQLQTEIIISAHCIRRIHQNQVLEKLALKTRPPFIMYITVKSYLVYSDLFNSCVFHSE